MDLFILAGVPHPLHTLASKYLEGLAGTTAKIIASPSPSFDGNLYPQRTIDSLLSGASRFAIRRLKNRSGDQGARPRRIVLLYVPAEDDEKLLEAFDFFVFPIPLRDLAAYDQKGKQKRHRVETCESALLQAVEVYKQTLVGTLQRRIESRRSSECLLLPPINFHLRNERLKKVFRELTRGARTWTTELPDKMMTETFNRERLPNFLREQEHQDIFRDARQIVFPCARPNEYHGLQEIDPDAEIDVLQDLLRTSYRFGAALPQGFHHDAQLEEGRQFNHTLFNCSRNGELLANGSHVNVYPNDFVRLG